MNTELKQFIKKHSNLFWYTPENKKEEISPSLLVETILNYGDMETVKELFQIMGIENVAKIFFDDVNKSERRKNNYYPEIYNFFSIVFSKYVQKNP
jgi:hypothetical protein